jgi:hypothetical protein
MKAKDKPHYVNNKDFSQAVVEYVNSANEAKSENKEEPIITEYIGECFLKIAEGLSHKSNFSGYTYREEMVMDAVENCIKAIMNYNVEKATRTGLPNAFAYFTQISYYAFLRRIAKEKKQQDIKEKYMEHAGAYEVMDSGNHPDALGIVDRIKQKTHAVRKRDESIKEFKKAQKNKRVKKKVAGKLDKFFNK